MQVFTMKVRSHLYASGYDTEKPIQASLRATVKSPECVGTYQRHDQNARSEDEDVPGRAQIEAADAAEEQVGDSKVEQAPLDIHDRGREADPGWRGEGTLEGMS